MKIRSLFFLSILVAMNFIFTNDATALVKSYNFGGRILDLNSLNSSTGTVCTAQYGMMTIMPLGGAFSPLPYIITATQKRIHVGQQILGRYTMNYTNCQNTSTSVPIPVPTFEINTRNLGTSR